MLQGSHIADAKGLGSAYVIEKTRINQKKLLRRFGTVRAEISRPDCILIQRTS
jgi:hypothetical protein